MLKLSQIPTFLNTAFSRKYSDPEKYHHYVLHNGRQKLSNLVTAKISELVPQKLLVLDLAAGTGILSNTLAEAGFSVLATDHNPDMFRKITLHAHIQTQFLDYNHTFKLPDDKFAAATILWGNRYIRNPEFFLRQVYRVLQPGGVFVWPIFTLELPLWIGLSRPRPLPTFKNLTYISSRIGFEIMRNPSRKFLSFSSPNFLVLVKPSLKTSP